MQTHEIQRSLAPALLLAFQRLGEMRQSLVNPRTRGGECCMSELVNCSQLIRASNRR